MKRETPLTDVCRCGHELGVHTRGKRGHCNHRYGAEMTCACLGFAPRPPMRHVIVSLSGETFEALAMLGRSYAVTGESEAIRDVEAVDRALVHLACSAADGVRRPGAWERGWIEQAFGELRTVPHRDGLPYHEEPPVTHVAGCVPASGTCTCAQIIAGNAREALRRPRTRKEPRR